MRNCGRVAPVCCVLRFGEEAARFIVEPVADLIEFIP